MLNKPYTDDAKHYEIITESNGYCQISNKEKNCMSH